MHFRKMKGKKTLQLATFRYFFLAFFFERLEIIKLITYNVF